jgi:glutamate synthase (ferredoxin)
MTSSQKAYKVLAEWETMLPRFVRVVPHDYKRVLDLQETMRDRGLTPEDAELAAFEANMQDPARVGGK